MNDTVLVPDVQEAVEPEIGGDVTSPIDTGADAPGLDGAGPSDTTDVPDTTGAADTSDSSDGSVDVAPELVGDLVVEAGGEEIQGDVALDPDPCAHDDNGGCDPLVSCSWDEESDTVACGPCPPTYSGDGETGCVPIYEEHLGFVTIPGVEGAALPYYRNHTLGTPNADITRAVVVIHGSNRTAKSYYGYMYQAAQSSYAIDETVILALHFQIAEDAPEPGVLFWDQNYEWKQGDESSESLGAVVSSFTVLDAVLSMLEEDDQFPALEEITIIGHSAGGQFVQRFAAGSPWESTLGIPVQYVVANPSSYLYLSGERVVAGTTDEFATPPDDDVLICFFYNYYKYGLEALNPYMEATGAAQIPALYQNRDVVYLLGEDDVDPAGDLLDTGCPAMLQGTTRFERGTIFFAYLEHFYGSQPHAKVTVPGVGHSASGMFTSPEGRAVVFGE